MVPIILEDGRIHMSSDGRAVDQLLHQHSMADARPLGRIWSWKIKLIRILSGAASSLDQDGQPIRRGV